MQQRHFHRIWRRDVHVTTPKVLFQLFCTCIWTSYLSQSDCLMVILKFYTVPMLLHAVKHFVNQKTRVNILPRKYDVISRYAKGLFAWRGSIIVLHSIKLLSTYRPTPSFRFHVTVNIHGVLSWVYCVYATVWCFCLNIHAVFRFTSYNKPHF